MELPLVMKFKDRLPALASEIAVGLNRLDVRWADRRAVNALLVSVGTMLYLFRKPISFTDDAYISFRYSMFLLRGNGLVWNIGDHPVEGFSNPLWVFLLTPFSFSAVALETAAYWISFFSLMAVAVVVSAMSLERKGGFLLSFSAGIICVALYPLTISGFIGIETGLYAGLLAFMLWALIRRRFYLAAVFGLLVAFVRFEGFAIGLVAMVASWFYHSLDRKRIGLTILAYVSGIFVLFASRKLYFDEWLPLPVMAKGGSIRLLVEGHFKDVWNFYVKPGGLYLMESFAGPSLLCLAAAVLLAVFRPRILWLLAPVVAGLFVAVLNGGDWMRGNRLIAQYMPAVMVVVVPFAADVAKNDVLRLVVALFFCGTAVVCLLMFPYGSHASMIKYKHHYWNDIGCFLESKFGETCDLVVAGQIGRLGYFAPSAKIIDFQGLVNPEIAKSSGRSSVYGKRDEESALSKKPAVVQTNNPFAVQRILAYVLSHDWKYLVLIDQVWNGRPSSRNYLIVRKDILEKTGYPVPFQDSKWISASAVLSRLSGDRL